MFTFSTQIENMQIFVFNNTFSCLSVRSCSTWSILYFISCPSGSGALLLSHFSPIVFFFFSLIYFCFNFLGPLVWCWVLFCWRDAWLNIPSHFSRFLSFFQPFVPFFSGWRLSHASRLVLFFLEHRRTCLKMFSVFQFLRRCLWADVFSLSNLV